MATFVTNFADNQQFYGNAYEYSLDDAFTNTGAVGNLFDSFSLSTRTGGETGDETASHRTGDWTDTMGGFFTGGSFHAVGTLAAPAGAGSWTVNGLIFSDVASLDDADIGLTMRSTAGLTINPSATD